GNAGPGVVITGAASRNTIGGLVAADRNVISGNVKQGIHIAGATSSTNVIQGNYVGTDAAGSSAVANGSEGVLIESADNVVGDARNVISGNWHGVHLSQPGASNNTIQGNWIGVASDGTTPLGNSAHGVGIDAGNNNVIWANVIANNSASGVIVYEFGPSFGT